MKNVLIAVLAGSVIPGIAAAQNSPQSTQESQGLEEVTVTAQRRTESLQDVPLAVSAFTANQLEERQVVSTIDLVKVVPNLFGHNNTGTSTANTYFLRGLGSTEQIALLDPAVSTYVDEVIIPRQNANNYALFDIERLEVLRGPQGTTFGRNSTGGAISVITRKPGDEFTGSVGIGVGSYGRKLVRGTVDVPFTDNVLSKFSGFFVEDDGWLRNVGNGEDVNASENWGVRAALRLLPTDTLTWDVSAEHIVANGVFARSFIGDSRNMFSSFTQSGATNDIVADMIAKRGWRNETDSTSITSTLAWELGGTTLSSITGWRTVDQIFVLDFGDPNPVVAGVRVPGTAANYFTFAINNDGQYDMFSQEFKANGSFGERLKYVAGLYFFSEDNITRAGQATGAGPAPLTLTCVAGIAGDGRTTCPTGARGYSSFRDMRNETTSYAAYAQVDWSITERATVIAGLRYTNDVKELDLVPTAQGGMITADLIAAGIATKLDESLVTPRLGVNFAVNQDVLLFVSATRGFKSGGWNSRTAYRPQEFLSMEPEKTWSYEAGIKSEFLDRRLRINANLYFAETKGLQLAYSQPGPPGTTLSVQSNAGDIETRGLELEVAARLGAFVDLFGSLGLQRGEYTEVYPQSQSFCTNFGTLVNGACTNPRPPATATAWQNAIDLDDRLSRFPEMTAALGVNVRIPTPALGGELRLSGEFQYTDDFATTASNARPNLQLIPNGPFVSGATVLNTLADSFSQFNIGLGYESEDGAWRASIDCKNCGDEAAVVSVFNGLFYTEPRRLNFALNYKF